MILKVIKRDGTKVAFDKQKIVDAILKAFIDVDKDVNDYSKAKSRSIANDIAKIEDREVISVEEIQDIIVDRLMNSSRKDVAENFIEYRTMHKMSRDKYAELMSIIKDKLEASNIQNQNANVDEMSFGGRMGEANDAIMRKYALDYILSDTAKYNHINNRVYTHDLSAYAVGMHNCMSCPLDDLLANGFNTRQTDVRPANSANTAFQLVAVLFQLQSLQQFGGVSATHLDWTMVPYVRKSFYKYYKDYEQKIFPISKMLRVLHFKRNKKLPECDNIINTSIDDDCYKANALAYKYAMRMTKKEVYQGAEGLSHNLNTLQSRSGNQLPFTSINYGTCTKPEGRMVIKSLLQVSIKGLGKLHRTSVFPCGIFQYMKGVNNKKGTPNYDLFRLALKSTAKRLYPNYANVDWSGNAGYDINDPRTYFSTMGCRTANSWDINGFGQLKDGRGNICPVTIILPTLAMEAKEKINECNIEDEEERTSKLIEIFMDILDKTIHEAKDQLIDRFKYIASQDARSAKFMYENRIMAGYNEEEGIISALKHGTLALGQLGLAECLQILIGKDHTEFEGMNLAKRIEDLFKRRCTEFKNHYSLNFGVYYSPAENLCYTAMKKFKEKYGEIPNVSDKDFFTNSMHIPVWHNISPFKKIDLESQLTGYSSAGCITYVELEGGVKNNIDALEEIVTYAMEKDIPYFAVNVPNDMCMNCGYTDELNDCCTECNSTEIQRLRRVTGYLTGDYMSAFNKGKQQEVKMRKKHK